MTKTNILKKIIIGSLTCMTNVKINNENNYKEGNWQLSKEIFYCYTRF